jgi:hypothetical protein
MVSRAAREDGPAVDGKNPGVTKATKATKAAQRSPAKTTKRHDILTLPIKPVHSRQS